jgi:hypothetical protein
MFETVFDLPSAMEARKLSLAQQSMEDVSHFVEEGHDVIMAHESGFIRGGLSKIGDHSRQWVAAFPIGTIVSW